MTNSIKEALLQRRTNYALSNGSPISDEDIEEIVKTAVLHVPSAFNSQSTRIVLLLGENHRKLWEITKDILRKIVPAAAFVQTEAKINGAFESGHGTILYYEDQSVVRGLQVQFAAYKDNFPIWSQHTSAMHQFAIWTMLTDAGFGVNLQHYNPLIDEEVAKAFDINPDWKLIAEMPFGVALQGAGEKQFAPLEDRLKVFK
jgi:predicted oxidoreductase (fatty acid repression mutant protein)